MGELSIMGGGLGGAVVRMLLTSCRERVDGLQAVGVCVAWKYVFLA